VTILNKAKLWTTSKRCQLERLAGLLNGGDKFALRSYYGYYVTV